MALKLFIVDDEAPARNRLKTLLSDIAVQCPHELAGEADRAQAALDGIAAAAPDIVLLDVQMPGMSGIELARHLSARSGAPAVIFVSAHDEYALKAFEVHALDYLLKPVRADRLIEAIRRVVALKASPAERTATQSKLQQIATSAAALQARRRHFSVQERGRLLLIPVAEVVYLKAELKYVTLRTATHEYLIEESLMSIEEEMADIFIRVHRNTLVARDAIVGVEKGTIQIDAEGEGEKAHESWQVILRGIDDRLPISRRQWPLVKAQVR